MAEIIQINSNTWRVEDGMVRFFILEGTEKSLVIELSHKNISTDS